MSSRTTYAVLLLLLAVVSFFAVVPYLGVGWAPTHRETVTIVSTRILTPPPITHTTTTTVTVEKVWSKIVTMPITMPTTITITKTRTATVIHVTTLSTTLTKTKSMVLTVERTVTKTVTSTRTVTVYVTKTVTKYPGYSLLQKVELPRPPIPLSSAIEPHEVVSVRILGGHLVVAVRGLLTEVAIYRPGEGVPALAIAPSVSVKETEKVIGADYVFANRSLMICAISIGRLLQTLEPGDYSLALWSGNTVVLEASLTVMPKEIAIDISETRTPKPISCSGLSEADLYYPAILCGIDPESLETLRRATGINSSNPVDVVWRVAEWVDRNLEYSETKAESGASYVQTPLETLAKRSGVCSDYAVFTAAMFIASGLNEGFIALIRWIKTMPGHAVALANLGKALVVVDQRIPPMEWQDYLQYIANNTINPITSIHLYKIYIENGEPQIEAWRVAHIVAPDTWPSDTLPKDFAQNVAEYVSHELGLTPLRRLENIVWLIHSGYYGIAAPCLSGIAVSNTVPLSKFYSPIFHRYWVKMYGEMVIDILSKDYPNARYFWIEIGVAKDGDYVKVYATRIEPPVVKISMSDSKAVIHIVSNKTLESISILVYHSNETEPFLGIAPPGYVYTSIKTVNAEEWSVSESKATIVFDVNSLKSAGCRSSDIMIVWVGREPVYAIKLSTLLRT